MNGPDILVVDAGSSSLHLTVLGGDGRERAARHLTEPPGPETADTIEDFLRDAPPVGATGHRIVHGGPHLLRPTIVDDDVRAELDRTARLAPLHMPPALTALDATRALLPDVPHVVCLDTAFHADLPPAARTYAVPREWTERYGLRRYGFHGLSYAWALQRAAGLIGRPAGSLHVVLAHLGGGCSVCAVRDGRSVDTTMGFTPLEGLVMSKRSGSVDPGLLLWLQTSAGLTAARIEDALNHESGLLGLSGMSGDTRDLVRAGARGTVRRPSRWTCSLLACGAASRVSPPPRPDRRARVYGRDRRRPAGGTRSGLFGLGCPGHHRRADGGKPAGWRRRQSVWRGRARPDDPDRRNPAGGSGNARRPHEAG